MKRIKLHLKALALFAPVLFAFMSSTIIICVLGAIYFGWIVTYWSSTKIGRKFLREYYREILRIEQNLR